MKNIMKIFLIIMCGGVGLALLMFASVSIYTSIDEEKEIEKAPQAVEGETIRATPEEKVHEVHADLNAITGWEKYENYEAPDAPNWEQNALGFKLIDVTLEEAIEDSEGDLKEDLERARKMLNMAVQNHDVEGLIYLHRIVHDLDHELNEEETKDVYNSAKAGAGDGSAIPSHEEYINQHSTK